MIQPLLGNGICGRKLIKPGGSIHQCHMIIVILTVFVVRIQFCVITDSPMYQCLEGFKPKSLNNWNSMDWSQGCVLGKPFSCQSKEVFVKFSELKLPDTTKSWVPNGGQDLYIRIEASKQGIVLGQDNWTTEGPKEDTELPFFDLATIVNATDNFSFNKKLGEGGFGPEYKGTLVDGREIAVKRLSKSSGQGLNEFQNATLLFLSSSRSSVELHVVFSTFTRIQDYELFRDMKASNVLLDAELNPKISDFGLARTFQGNQCGDNTERVVGTFGYMAPEYALYGLFSVKSDVFSFGLLLLEIAWRMWMEGTPLELVDSSLEDESSSMLEILRCIHVSLLCVKQSPDDRPNMSAVVLMLNGESTLPQPKDPGFLRDVIPTEISFIRSDYDSYTANEITFSSLGAR
ncbi:hypothetical protein K7X08_022729 [Anisodus acutangulus]|uniref:Protein kinase domain-containing protein n=1 Tax=Anisodus acutangulus TaxID=402998 RepID=A0A9Q1MB42_9SOLA|nr:hypothetical protein K7X08_022729 [Anisodus acutangulus]